VGHSTAKLCPHFLDENPPSKTIVEGRGGVLSLNVLECVKMSYWLLVIGYWLLVIGYWLLVIGYWLKIAFILINSS
jgi:hypothetical protein